MVSISWFALGVIIIAPNIMSFLQLSLSRMREFDADYLAVLLTGDPEGLAMALGKLEAYETTTFDILFSRNGHSAPIPSILRTHPNTEARIERLLALKAAAKSDLDYSEHDRFAVPADYQQLIRKPQWHVGGFWY
jgi:Zn-dependent protease with chaperone function